VQSAQQLSRPPRGLSGAADAHARQPGRLKTLLMRMRARQLLLLQQQKQQQIHRRMIKVL
jgi:hypothetical protein